MFCSIVVRYAGYFNVCWENFLTQTRCCVDAPRCAYAPASCHSALALFSVLGCEETAAYVHLWRDFSNICKHSYNLWQSYLTLCYDLRKGRGGVNIIGQLPIVPDRSLQPLRRADGPVPAAADQQVRQGRDELQRQQRQPRHKVMAYYNLLLNH